MLIKPKAIQDRDDLSKLFEQSRYCNPNKSTQDYSLENMREFLLLCEHLDTHPIRNSNRREYHSQQSGRRCPTST
ncbi:hypothetical protein H5410_064899 [Solanum commersonii]|uniref:Uncharacterized protein n=1 Tax=Solanum commersonii TaxID=4109 RepID=A0A9J5VY44_SOLCO|nr:hypothetical protein H5410_064899 [Solanum commersonii]